MCRLLVDLDEWGQLMWLNLLLRYARTMLPKPSADDAEDTHSNDIDLELLLSSSESLLHSRNPAVSCLQPMWQVWYLTFTQVILAVTRVMFYLGSNARITRAIPALLRLLDNSPEVERTVLPYLFSISCKSPVRLLQRTTRAAGADRHF